MPVYWLDPNELAFPNPNEADPGGLLGIGGALSPEWLVLAYQHGIFPWFEEDEAFYWYCPSPRFVLYPDELKVHKSMRSIFNQNKFRFSLDTAFSEVITSCSKAPRPGQDGTWISSHFVEAYTELHHLGLAHSVEVWDGEALVGGLYGVSLGRVFYGESMFAHQSNASKAGFITLVRALQKTGFTLIDCQAPTPHLRSLGARGIPRTEFLDHLHNNSFEKTLIGKWAFDGNGQVTCTPGQTD
ncbi:MAG: leucyl/phenylalanyl-tRNA--protein transferase [Saprospiraceae bacterium]